MTSLIGYNCHSTLSYGRGYSDDEKRRFWEHLERLQPESLLFLDNFDMAKEAKRRLPACRVVFREYRGNDGRFFRDMSAQQFYDSHAKFGQAGLIVSIMNEPTGYGEQKSPEDLERIADFMAGVLGLFGRAGLPACGPEFGVGHPDTNRLIELDAMWEAFKAWPIHYYGCHEYGTYRGMTYTDETHNRDVVPWRVGRYKEILRYVKARFGYDLPVLVNEFGIDSSFFASDVKEKRGWRDASISEVQYAVQLIKAAVEVYTEPNVKGLNIFAHGNSGKKGSSDDWTTHDVSFLRDFQKTLEDYSKARVKEQPVFPLPQDPRWIPSENYSGENYRIRLIAQVDDTPELGWIKNAEKFSYIGIEGNPDWLYGKNISGVIGYVSRDVLSIQPPKKTDPPPAPPPLSKVAIQEQIAAINASILTLAKYRVKVEEGVSVLEEELSAERHLSNALQDSIELQKLNLEWLKDLLDTAAIAA